MRLSLTPSPLFSSPCLCFPVVSPAVSLLLAPCLCLCPSHLSHQNLLTAAPLGGVKTELAAEALGRVQSQGPQWGLFGIQDAGVSVSVFGGEEPLGEPERAVGSRQVSQGGDRGLWGVGNGGWGMRFGGRCPGARACVWGEGEHPLQPTVGLGPNTRSPVPRVWRQQSREQKEPRMHCCTVNDAREPWREAGSRKRE